MKNSKILILLTVFFICIGIIYSYPLILHFHSAIPYTENPVKNFEETGLSQGDQLQFLYSLWLFKDYFTSSSQRFFKAPYQFDIKNYPRPFTLRELPLSIVFWLFSSAGNTFAYNCLVILSFPLAGIFMFLLAKKYLRDIPSSVIAGLIFAIIPFRLAHLFGGHPSGFLLFWIPLIIYLYELLWDKGKQIYGWLAGLCIFLMIMEEPHLGYYSALFTILFWLYKIIIASAEKKANIKEIIKLSVPIATSWLTVGLYMFFIKHIVIGASIAGGGRNIAEIRLYAPSIADIFRRTNSVSEKYIYIGAITSILLAFSAFFKIRSALRHPHKKDLFPFLFYSIVFAAALILSLGPNLRWFPLYKLCYKIVPFFRFPRSPARIIVFAYLSLSLLAGYGIKYILQDKSKILKNSIAVSILALICIDFKPYPLIGISNTVVKGNKTYQYIKDTYPKNPILEIPIWPGDCAWSSIYEYYTTIYRIPSINGYSAMVGRKYVKEIFWPLVSINMGILTAGQYNLLKQLRVKYINLHEEAYPPKVSPFPFKIALGNLKRNPYCKFITEDGPLYLFEILDKSLPKPAHQRAVPAKTGLFYECGHMPHKKGKSVNDKQASAGTALFINSPASQPMYFVYGPWKLFPPGRYKIIFRLKGIPKKAEGPFASIEVTTNKGTKKIAHKNINAEQIKSAYTDYELNFALEKTIRLEFRIIYYGNGKLWADYIYLLCRSEKDPALYYEAENLYHIGKEIYDKNASADSAVYARKGKDPAADIVFGPYRRYRPGRYKIGFRLKAKEKINKPICTIKAVIACSNIILAKKTLTGRDFLSKNKYEYHYITIDLENPCVLEFKLQFKGNTDIYIDNIKIDNISN